MSLNVDALTSLALLIVTIGCPLAVHHIRLLCRTAPSDGAAMWVTGGSALVGIPYLPPGPPHLITSRGGRLWRLFYSLRFRLKNIIISPLFHFGGYFWGFFFGCRLLLGT